MGNFKIYRSSAGSGKTFTLVREYIKLSFKYPMNFKNILAVTFTNMATDEMRSKIISELDMLSRNKDTDLRKELVKEGIEEKAMPQKAKEVLSQILHNYSSFSVSTIDSFFHRVLRSFSKELKLSPGYSVELDENKVLEELVNNLWFETGSDKELQKFITEFIEYNMSINAGWRIESSLFKLGKEIFKDRYWERKLLSGKIFKDNRDDIKELIEDLKEIRNNFEKDLKEIGEHALQLMARHNLEIKDIKSGKNGPANHFKKISDQTSKDWYEPTDTAINASTNSNLWITKNSKLSSEIRNCLDDGLLNFLNLAIDYYNKYSSEYLSSLVILRNIFILGIFNDLVKLMQTYESDNNIILHSNISRILRLLISGENSPFIFDKIGSNYRHFLIDEFQDTSTFQWKNFIPLIINSLSEKRFSMVVGDAKQSIYRWRNGNMRLILADIYKDLSNFKSDIKTENLKINYRSAKNIIDFNNLFFKSISDVFEMNTETGRNIISAGYGEDVTQTHHRTDVEGYVNLRWIESDSKTTKSDSIEKANENLREIIKEVKNANYSNKDITVLVRNKQEGIMAANLLLEINIPVISSESLLLIQSPKVMLIISAFKYISDRKNDIAAAELIFNYNKYIKENNFVSHELFDLIKAESDNNIKNVLPESFIKKDGYLNSVFYNLNVYELTEHLIKIFELDKIPDLYIIKLIDVIREYSLNNSSDINSFLEWWQKNSEGFAISTPDNIDAVRILTIHKMKGLQNKVIIIPYASWETEPKASRDYMWVSSDRAPFNFIPAFPVPTSSNLSNTLFDEDYQTEKDLTFIDNLNLLYVALTRAGEALYVISYDWRDNNTGRLIKNRIENIPELKSKFTNNELKFGKLPEKEKIAITDKKSGYKFISSEWQKKAVIRPSNYGIKPWESRFDSVSEGILIHEILSRIKTKDEFDRVLNDYLTNGMISETKAVSLKQKFAKIIKDEKINNWFSGVYEVLNEAEITDEAGSLIRPDRIMIKDDNAVLLDYKTGKESKTHEEQMKKYITTVKKLGYNNIEGYILYLSHNYNLIQV